MSKTVLYMAISTDGFIAGPDDETPWSEDEWLAFRDFITSCDVVLLGRRTFEIMRDEDGFIEGPEYVVVTNNTSFDSGSFRTIGIKSRDDMPKSVKVGVIGGGELNGQLAQLGLIDELILDIEPVVLGNGIRLFGKYDVPLKLKLLGSKDIGPETVQRHYEVIHD